MWSKGTYLFLHEQRHTKLYIIKKINKIGGKMREILKRLSCLSLIAFLCVSGLFINKTNASTEAARANYFARGIDNFDKLSYEEQKNFVNTCNSFFAREENFINKYFEVIDPFLLKLGLVDIVDLMRRDYDVLWYQYKNTTLSKEQLFKMNVELFVLGNSFIEQNSEDLHVRAITALINGTEFS